MPEVSTKGVNSDLPSRVTGCPSYCVAFTTHLEGRSADDLLSLREAADRTAS